MTKSMLLLPLLLTVVSVYAQNKELPRPEIGKYCKVYRGTENLQITMLRVGKEAANEVLFEMVGIDHPYDGKILKAKSVVDGLRTNITIKVDGRDWVIATKRNDEQSSSWSIYLPNKGAKESEYQVYYSEARSADCKPEYLLTAWIEGGRK